MSNAALIGCSVTAGLLILVALSTPGWFGLDIKTKNGDVSVAMNMFYVRVCTDNIYNGEVNGCLTVSVSEAVSSKKLSMGDTERYTELMAESVLAIIGILVGTICAVIFGATVANRRDDTRTSSNGLGITGLVFTIIGGISGGILCIEFIIVHTRYDEVMQLLKSDLSSNGIEKAVPYSLIIMSIGLFAEFIAIIVHIAALRSNYRAVPVNGIILTPAVNAPSQVVVQHSTVSSTPYARFA